MNRTLTIASKELRGAFQSPVALLFLGVFLVMALFDFFTLQRFFARNIADLRPFFTALPLLLIFLVSAVAMRAWAEERRSGTIEILLTLPVRPLDLVLGKFTAGMVLVALALALTLPLPFTVAALGPLDWGPVIGGYAGALLLAGAYLAIGLCVSARTDNQVVALLVTLVVGGLLYLVGHHQVTALAGTSVANALRQLGTGSRFESVERGVLDLRDIAYYAGIAVFFLALNLYFIERDRLDTGSPAGRRRQRGLLLGLLLVGANVLAADAWLAPVSSLRADLTQNGDYSISDVTRGTIASLDEPLAIEGYFSERTHPLLAPLVPQLRDLLEELRIQGGGKVSVAFYDPTTDPDLEQRIGEQYGIRSVPFRVEEANANSVVNAFFHVLVKYGDQHEVLSFDDLVEVNAGDQGIEVRLRDPEYDITRAIRKISRDFQSTGSLAARLPQGSKLVAYVTPDTLPDEYRDVPRTLAGIAKEIQDRSKGHLSFEQVDPSKDPSLPDKLYEQHDIRPLALDLFGTRTFYLHVLLQAGDRSDVIFPGGEMKEADLRKSIDASLRRVLPGQLHTVGLVTAKAEAPRHDPRLPPQYQPPARPADYQGLEQTLSQSWQVERLDLSSGFVPAYVDVLVVGKTGSMSESERYAVDQFLMRGGSVIALAGHWAIDVDRGGLSAVEQDSGLEDLLKTWGVTIDHSLVMDPHNTPFPIPVHEQRGMFSVQRIEYLPYPFLADVRPDAFDRGNPVMSGLPNVVVPWASPLELADHMDGVQVDELLHSSAQSWLNLTGDIDPDFTKWPEAGFGPTGGQQSRLLAASLQGTFDSAFADKPSPVFGQDAEDDSADRTGRTLKRSLPDARLVVIGSGEIASDLLVGLSRNLQGEVLRANMQLMQNLVDWSVEDTDLLKIRSSGAFARTLEPLTDAERTRYEAIDYGLVLGALLLVVVLPRRRRRRVQPLSLATTEEA